MRRGRPRHEDILTPREWEVLALLEQGKTNEEIARTLGISFGGAKYHVSEIITKLGAESREEAVARARAHRRRAVLPAWLPFFGRAGREPAAALPVAAAAIVGVVALLFAVALLAGWFRGSGPELDLSALGPDTGMEEAGEGTLPMAALQGPRPYLGVTEAMAQDGTVYIREIEPDSPAAMAGLSTGDLVQTVGGTAVGTPRQLRDALAQHAAGSAVELGLAGGRIVPVTLGAAECLPVPDLPGPGEMADFVSLVRIDLFVVDLTPVLRDWFDVDRANGVVVITVRPGGVTDVRVGDVILEFGDVPVTNAEEIERVLEGVPVDAPLPLRVLRCREELDLVLSPPGLDLGGANAAPPEVREKLAEAIARGDLAEVRLELEVRNYLTSASLGFVREVSADAIVIEALLSGEEGTWRVTPETMVHGADSVTDLREGLMVNLLSQDGTTAVMILSLAEAPGP